MTIFDLIRILFFKLKSTEDITDESLQCFSPFMINRWLTFYDKDQAVLVNETFNKFGAIFNEKDKTFKFYQNLIPRLKFKKISYIKKVKAKKEDEIEHLQLVATNKNISKRELEQYIDLLNHLSK